jgi:very-short-patch-repair endonuclease
MANERARQLRKSMTFQEVRLWKRLRAFRELGYHFRRQSPVDKYIVDFECRKARIVVELDGGQHNRNEHAVHDAVRDARLKGLGYSVLRFWNHEVDQNIEGVLQVIHTRLSDGSPHPGRFAATLP